MKKRVPASMTTQKRIEDLIPAWRELVAQLIIAAWSRQGKQK